MALSGLEQRFAPLEFSYQPFGPVRLPPWAILFDEEETPAPVIAAARRRLFRSKSHSGYAPWNSTVGASRPKAEGPENGHDEQRIAGAPRKCQRADTKSSIAESDASTTASSGCGESDGSPPPITTIMITALRTCVTRAQLMKTLARVGFEGRFDYVHMPMNFGTSENRGVAFVNFVDAATTTEFLSSPNLPPTWGLKVAKKQGFAANMQGFKGTKAERVRNRKNKPFCIPTKASEPSTPMSS